MKLTVYRTAVFPEKGDLPAFICTHVPALADGDVLAVTSKLVCLWKGCALPFQSRAQKERLIRAQSQAALRTKLAWWTIKNGMVMTNAGVDESNAGGKLLFLPEDMYACAAQLRRALQKHYGVKKLGVLITDSMILPLRAGVTGAAVAYSGFAGVRDERGKKDIFGRPLQTTLVDVADALAAAAALMMGERREQTPLCRVEQAPVQFVARTDPSEICYPPEQDLYAPLFRAAGLTKRRKKHEKCNR